MTVTNRYTLQLQPRKSFRYTASSTIGFISTPLADNDKVKKVPGNQFTRVHLTPIPVTYLTAGRIANHPRLVPNLPKVVTSPECVTTQDATFPAEKHALKPRG